MNLSDFELVTGHAFSFLTAEHAYTALPAERGGRFGSAYVRRFVRGSYEIALAFGDVDSHHLCTIWFRDDVGQNIVEHGYMHRDLIVLLAERHPTFIHPARADLSGEVTAESIIAQYANALRDLATTSLREIFQRFRP